MKSKNKKGLGRGLTALFGDQKAETNKKEISKFNTTKINISDL